MGLLARWNRTRRSSSERGLGWGELKRALSVRVRGWLAVWLEKEGLEQLHSCGDAAQRRQMLRECSSRASNAAMADMNVAMGWRECCDGGAGLSELERG